MGNKGFYDTMFAGKKEDMLERAHSALLLCLADNVLLKGLVCHLLPFDGGKVLMENNVACKVVGICSIQIMMHDGIVKTLIYVRHVPELRKNLIYLGNLDFNGRSYRAAGGVIRIMKGALVVMKGLKQNNLYLLQGSTVTGPVAVASSFDIDSDTTKLWHMHLGHMSERDTNVLSKQVWSGTHANYENLRIFGYPTYTRVNDGKLEPRAKKCIFLGYATEVKGYRLWCLDSKSSRFLISRDVTFNESLMLSEKDELIDAGKDHGAREKVVLEVQVPDSLPKICTDEKYGSHSTEENEETQEQQYSITRNKSRREIQPLQKYGYADIIAYALSVVKSIEFEEPITYKETLKNTESTQ
ncbi:hypothetical protein RJ639_027833 [Escallonia herrerae]|uniref:GAG-pre-integrase domain-containing protein n=1 Tax=Escallonia herrerae TaxID=1293975 RepID=A0AA88X565_9ASTE|nr:hypothetical protein RJ639_027833 [Escallonia herrerae]